LALKTGFQAAEQPGMPNLAGPLSDLGDECAKVCLLGSCHSVR
jgi:hypothetical protein